MDYLSTQNKDQIVLIALDLGISDVFSLCKTNKRLNAIICQNDNFWINKLVRDYNLNVGYIPQNKTPKEYYLFVTQMITKYTDKKELLIESSKKGYLGLVKYSLEKGVNVNARNDFALRLASNNGHLEVVKFLVENGANVNAEDDYALRLASGNGHLEVVKFLVENGANIHARNDLALRWASRNGHLEVVKFLVENGANVHAQNDSALRLASKRGHLEVVNYLKSLT